MGSSNFQIAALHNDSAANAAENADAPQALAPSPVLPARGVSTAPPPKPVQDTVSLSGTLLPHQRQQNAPSAGNAQPATFTLLAQTTTFPASQNNAAAATPPTIQRNAPTVAASPPAQAPAATQSPVANAPASADATAMAVTASSAAPAQQTLQQLDRVLQQLGIDPQTLSLISREGMLNWVNDPAALRQIVQKVQAAANRSQQNAAVGSAKPAQTTAQLAIASANQNNQIQSPQTQNQPQASAQETSQVSASSAAASNNNTNALDQSAATAQQNATAVAQFQKLQDSLAPSGTTEAQPAATSSGTTTPHGQFLNVSV
jgi:hypothetical protein